MRYFVHYRLLCVIGFIALASDVPGQTLFARPDTMPAYVSYQYIEECLAASYRVADDYEKRRDSIWYDTAAPDLVMKHKRQIAMSRRPESAIEAARVCLQKFNADTATFLSLESATRIIQILLVAHRDQDAHQFAQRMLDSMRLKSATDHKVAFWRVIETYGRTRPMRVNEVKQYLTEFLALVAGDSSYWRIDAAMMLAGYEGLTGDSASSKEWNWYAVRTNDATPVEERLGSPGSQARLAALAAIVRDSTKEDGLDSLAISTVAYQLWEANTVKQRVYGGETVTADEITPYKVPELRGDHYYTATSGVSAGPSSQGMAPYTNRGVVPGGALPVKNRINYITTLPSICHIEEAHRSIDKDWKRKILRSCVRAYVGLRRAKKQFPDLEVIVLSSTYGTVGQLGPLEPADEADTLAKFFLGFHHVPAHLVVETTEFFHVAEPDGRRIDLPTANSEALGRTVLDIDLYWFTDKEGFVVSPLGGGPGSTLFKRFYEILQNRPSKQR